MKKERQDKDFIHKPSFPGGAKGMKAFVSAHLQYPEEAQRAGIGGTVRLRIAIDHKGKVTEARVIMGLGFGCDEEAVRVALLMRFNVPPHRKLKVLFHHVINIHFLRGPAPEEKPAMLQPPEPAGISYTITPAAPEKTEGKPAAGGGYTITINWT
jgi:TonB family protein